MKKKILKRSVWKIKEERFVAFFDILGFKDLVMRSEHDDVYEKLKKISEIKFFLQKKSLKNKNLLESTKKAEIHIVSFSDSIIIFSKNDNIDNLNYFLTCIRWLFAKTIHNNIPMKGAIAHGIVSVNSKQQIYFGQPIIDAYLMEEEVNYFGVVAHSSIDKYLDNKKNIYDFKYANEFFFECKTPLKCGSINHKNINWFNDIDSNEKTEKEVIKNVLLSFNLTCSGSPRRYIDNTIDVLERIDLSR